MIYDIALASIKILNTKAKVALSMLNKITSLDTARNFINAHNNSDDEVIIQQLEVMRLNNSQHDFHCFLINMTTLKIFNRRYANILSTYPEYHALVRRRLANGFLGSQAYSYYFINAAQRTGRDDCMKEANALLKSVGINDGAIDDIYSYLTRAGLNANIGKIVKTLIPYASEKLKSEIIDDIHFNLPDDTLKSTLRRLKRTLVQNYPTKHTYFAFKLATLDRTIITDYLNECDTRNKNSIELLFEYYPTPVDELFFDEALSDKSKSLLLDMLNT